MPKINLNFFAFRIPIANIFLSRRKRQAQDAIIQVTNSDTINLSDEKLLASDSSASERTTKRSVPVSTKIQVNDFNNVPTDTTVKAVIEVRETNTDRVPKVIKDDQAENVQAKLLTHNDNVKQDLTSADYSIAPLKDASLAEAGGSQDGKGNTDVSYGDYANYANYDYPSYSDYYDSDSDDELDEQYQLAEEFPDVYCDLIETLDDRCLETSILELWNFDEVTIRRSDRQL